MKEAELRTEVLIPLFRAMHYRDVIHYHGGSGEQGKDIVMWKAGDFDQRTNYGVVAKVGKVSGKASGKGSAAQVVFQINQSFGSSYRDGITGDDQWINGCIVVASGVISKEARDSIKNAVSGTRADRSLLFINGDKLWELVEKHLAESVVLDKLAEARDVFENVSPHHRITASIEDGSVVLSTQPKYAGAEKVEPITIKFKLVYPNTPEGIAAREGFTRHISTGSPVTVPQSFLSDVEMPKFLRPFLKTDQVSHLVIGPRRWPKPLAGSLLITPEGGPAITIDGLEFRAVQAGQNEVTLDNSHQLTQWHFKIRLNKKEQSANVTFDWKAERKNVKRELDKAKLWGALTVGCRLALVNADTGLNLFEGKLAPRRDEGPPAGYADFLEQVLLIQTRTGIPVTIPARNISQDEIRVIYELAARLRNGSISGTSNSLWVVLHRAGAENLATGGFEEAGHVLSVVALETWTVLDTAVPVGRSVSVIQGMTLAPGTIEEIAKRLREEPDCDSFKVQFRPIEESAQVTIMYPDSTGGSEPEDIRKLDAVSHLSATPEELR
jgi:hypothetical protein